MVTKTESLCDRLISGERAALAQALSVAEEGGDCYFALRRSIAEFVIGQCVLGVTGPPGAGKSSLVNALIKEWRQRGHRVAVIAVDPSSPISGGALLGDRVRMSAALDDEDVYVRSLSSTGNVGGLAPAAVRLIDLFDVAKFDRIIVETVGAGQSEIDIAAVAEVKVVVSAPGLGDGIQAIKSGLLEIADLLVVNKSDQPGADATAEQLRNAVSLRGHEGAHVPVLLASATKGDGVAELTNCADDLLEQASKGEARDRLRRRARFLVGQLAGELLRKKLDDIDPSSPAAAIIEDLARGEIDPLQAARTFLQEVFQA